VEGGVACTGARARGAVPAAVRHVPLAAFRGERGTHPETHTCSTQVYEACTFAALGVLRAEGVLMAAQDTPSSPVGLPAALVRPLSQLL
jgi:hypothetical protein